jgi:hypothetical protein
MVIKINNKTKINKTKINKTKINKNKINKTKINKNKTKINKNKTKKYKTKKYKTKKYKINKKKIGGVTNNVSDLDKVKLFQSSLEQHEQIVEDSIKQMFVLKRFDPNRSRRLDQLGTKSEGIIFFDTINSQTNETVSYVLKEVQSPGYLKEEALFHSNKINEWNKILENYSTIHNINIPIFAKYYDTKKFEEMNVTYLLYRLQFAPGDTLKKIAKNIQQKKYSNNEIEQIQTNIGEQLGYLIKAMYQHNKTIIMHGDLSDNNIIYDINTNKMYWIDLGGTHEISFVENELEYKNAINKIIKLFKKISTKPIIENIINTIEYSKI